MLAMFGISEGSISDVFSHFDVFIIGNFLVIFSWKMELAGIIFTLPIRQPQKTCLSELLP